MLMFTCDAVFSSVYFVSFDEGQCRSNETCHTLNFYAQASELFFTDDAVFNFLPGKHCLNQTILVTAVENLTLQGQGVKEVGFHETIVQTSVKIECENSVGGFAFLDVIDLTLKGLSISECNSRPLGAVESQYLLLFYEYLAEIGTVIQELGIFNASVSLLEVSNVHILDMSIQNATQIGLAGINVYNSTIESSSFSINNLEPIIDCTRKDGRCLAGNIIIGFTYSWPNDCYGVDTVFTLDINNCNFSFAHSLYTNEEFPGGGISIFIDNYSRYSVQFSMVNINAYNNTALPGGNINIVTSESSLFYSFNIQKVSSMFGNEMLQTLSYLTQNKSVTNFGGGLLLSIGIASQTELIGECSSFNLQLPEYVANS